MQYSSKYVIRFVVEFLAANHVLKGTVHQPNKFLSYAQFCLHWTFGKFHLVTGV